MHSSIYAILTTAILGSCATTETTQKSDSNKNSGFDSVSEKTENKYYKFKGLKRHLEETKQKIEDLKSLK